MSTPTVTSEAFSPPSSLGEISEDYLFDDPDADIILRSCDHREFQVLKLYVIKASPVLQEAVQSALSSPTAITTPSLPSVQLSDSGDTLSSLLSFILPIPSVLPSTIEQTMLLLSAAQKYQMEFVMGSIRAVIALQDPPFVRQETALQVYSLAQMHGLRQEALHAARGTFTLPFTLEDLEDELGTTPLVDLHGLWKHHQRVRTYLADGLGAFQTTGLPSEMTDQPCSYGTLNWLGEYIDSIAKSPALFDITEFHMFLSRHTSAEHSGCKCASIPSRVIRAFWVALTNVVHDCMTRAESDIVILGGLQTETGLSPQNTSPLLPDPLDMANADIIIRSCDFINFRVHKLVLSLSSPFFDDVFSFLQPPYLEDVDGLPVVHLSEDAELLNCLLTMLYPIPSIIPNSYDKTLMLLSASQKYKMDGIQSRIRAEVQSKKLPMPTGAATFHAYAIASIRGLSPERETLARLTLDFPMTFEYLSDELPFFEGWVLRDLIRFRKCCRDNLISCFESFLNLHIPPFDIWKTCTSSSSHRSTTTGRSPSWLTNLFQKRLTELGQTFTNPLPNASDIREGYLSALQAHIASARCIACPLVHAMSGEMFCKEIENRLALAIGKIQ